MTNESKAEAREAKAEAKAEARAAKAELKAERRLEREGERYGRPKRSKLKTVAVVSGRGLAGLTGIAATVVVLAGIAVIPWPSWGVSAPVTNVDPTAEDQQRVCPGPLLTVGASSTQANTISSLGAATVLNVGGKASTLRSENPNAAADGLPQVFTADADAAPVAAAQSQNLALENYAGLTAAACTAPSSDSWLVGGATTLGFTQVLVLGNPTTLPATVNVEAFGANGKISTTGLGGITVDPGSQVALPLAGYVPNEAALVLHVTATGGRVAAVIDSTQIAGVTPVGAEVIGGGAAPAKEVVIPGVVVDASVSTAEHGEGADNLPTLRLLASNGDAEVSVTVIGENGAVGTELATKLSSGTVSDLSLTGLAAGSYSVSLTADKPVVAAVQTALTAAEGTDFAWFASADALTDDTAIPVPTPATLHLTNPTALEVTVSFTGPAGRTEVKVPPTTSTSVALDAGAWRASGSAQLFASLSLQSPGRLASMLVPSASANAAAVAVYTR